MSINALTNAALARRHDFEPANAVPRSLRDIAHAAGAPPRTVAGGASATNGTTTTLQTLTTYIPTEVLTLYVSAIAAVGPAVTKGGVSAGRWLPFWCFLVATPLIVWLAFATKLKAAGKPLPASPVKWPIWEMVAATIAYFAWTFALPNTPFATEDWYSSGLAAFFVLVVSAGLGMIAPLMQRRLSS
ncbi:MAG: hypothetical protein HY216_16810 [Candidatus Rokubacteria bacterium]|nr:hypothetical protein [Candidatus Rokubacteria bacterium]